MTPDAATAILPIFRHVGYLPLIVGNTPRGMLCEVHQNPFGVSGHRLAIHGNLAADIDALPNLALQTSAHAGFVQDTDPRAQCLELLQRVPITVEPRQDVQMGIPTGLKLQYPVIMA